VNAGAPRARAPILLWLLGLAVIAWLVERVDVSEVAVAAGTGPSIELLGFTALQLLVSFLADLWATWVGLRSVRVFRALRDLAFVRASSHLVGLVNFTLGQGAVGFYLSRSGSTFAEASLATFHIVAVSFATLGLLGAVAVGFGSLTGWPAWPLATPALLLTVIALLFAFGPLRFRRHLPDSWSSRLSLCGLGMALGSRALNFSGFIALYWVALRIWGFELSLAQAFPIVLALMLIAALPLTPYGTGTVQLGQVLLLAPYAPGASPAEREAFVLAFGLLHQAGSVATQLLIGLTGVIGWRQRLRAASPADAHGGGGAP